jgi:hypothetical protein
MYVRLDQSRNQRDEPPKDLSYSYYSSHLVTLVAYIAGCGCGRAGSLFEGVRARKWQLVRAYESMIRS